MGSSKSWKEKAVEVNAFILKISKSRAFQGESLLSNALGQVVHAHHLFFSLQYQMWRHQTALSITQLEETNTLQYTAQYSYGQPHDNDLNDHKAVICIIQNFKNKLCGRLTSCKTFQNSSAVEIFRSSCKICVIYCKPKWKCSTKYDPNQLKHLQVMYLWPKSPFFCKKNS